MVAKVEFLLTPAPQKGITQLTPRDVPNDEPVEIYSDKFQQTHLPDTYVIESTEDWTTIDETPDIYSQPKGSLRRGAKLHVLMDAGQEQLLPFQFRTNNVQYAGSIRVTHNPVASIDQGK